MLYLLLSAEFVAAAQVLVYAGAVMVMFLFVIAYLGGDADAPWARRPELADGRRRRAPPAAIFVEVVVVIGLKTGGRLSNSPDIEPPSGSPYEIGRLFLTDQLLAFEITSIVLLVAAVGGVILGSHSRDAPPAETRAVKGPDVTWYLGVAAFLFCTGALGVLHPPQPADRPALARDHAQRRQPGPDRVLAPLRRRATARSSRWR